MKHLDSKLFPKLVGPFTVAVAVCLSNWDLVMAAPLPTVTIASQQNGSEPAGILKYRFSRNGGDASQPLNVQFVRKPESTATPWEDFYHSGSGMINIPAWSSGQDLQINILDDENYEGHEHLVLQVVPGPGYFVGTPNTASTSITDNDFGLKDPLFTG